MHINAIEFPLIAKAFSKHKMRLLLGMLASLVTVGLIAAGGFMDEQENMATSVLMNHELLLYRDLFTHHAPLPYVVGSIIALIDFDFPIIFRFFLFLFYGLGLLLLINKKVLSVEMSLLLYLLLMLTSPRYLFHMYLAQSFGVAGLLLMGSALVKTNIYLFTFGSLVAAWSLPALWPVILLLSFWVLRNSKTRIADSVVLISPHLVIVVLLGMVNLWNDFWFSVVTFNQEVYVPYRWPGGKEFFSILLEGVYTNLSLPLITFVRALYTFLITFFHVGFDFKLLAVATNEFINHSHSEAVVMPVLFLIVSASLWFRKRAGLLLLHILVSVSLAIRSDEIFHGGVLYAWLVMLLCWLITVKPTRFLWVSALLIFAIYIHPFLSYLRRGERIVGENLLNTAQLIKSVVKPGSKIVLIEASPYLYVLSNTVPALRTHYIFPWIVAVPEFRNDLLLAMEQGYYVFLGREDSEYIARHYLWLDLRDNK